MTPGKPPRKTPSNAILAKLQETREKARAEYEKQTRGLFFAKDFHTRLEAVMHDKLATVGERVMAYILRYSWGEQVLYAMKDNGEPVYQRDIVRDLGLDKTSVSHAIAYNQRRGHLEDKPKLLCPVISPALTVPTPNDKKPTEFATFLADWKVAHSTENQEWEDARSTIKKFRKVVRSEYKKLRKTAKNAEASLLETARPLPRPGQRAAVSPLEADNLHHQKAPAQTPVEDGSLAKAEAAEYLFTEIERMQKAHKDTPFAKPLIDPNDAGDRGLVDRILTELGTTRKGRYDEQHLIGFILHITAQFKGWGMGGSRRAGRYPDMPNGPKSVGLLVNWVKDYVRVSGKGGQP